MLLVKLTIVLCCVHFLLLPDFYHKDITYSSFTCMCLLVIGRKYERHYDYVFVYLYLHVCSFIGDVFGIFTVCIDSSTSWNENELIMFRGQKIKLET